MRKPEWTPPILGWQYPITWDGDVPTVHDLPKVLTVELSDWGFWYVHLSPVTFPETEFGMSSLYSACCRLNREVKKFSRVVRAAGGDLGDA